MTIYIRSNYIYIYREKEGYSYCCYVFLNIVCIYIHAYIYIYIHRYTFVVYVATLFNVYLSPVCSILGTFVVHVCYICSSILDCLLPGVLFLALFHAVLACRGRTTKEVRHALGNADSEHIMCMYLYIYVYTCIYTYILPCICMYIFEKLYIHISH